ncbi:MAG: chromosomal replication initiator DnaA [Acetobacteraceae bacterium]
MRAARQLVLPFVAAPEYSAADFLEAPGNAEARAWLARPAEWPAQRLALWGEAGVGKSHLLHLWADRVGASVLSGAAESALAGPPGGPLALDDADLFGPEPALLHLLNSAAEAHVALLMAARAPPARWAVRLPDLASRLAAVAAVAVGALDDARLGVLFARLLSARQLVLSPSLASLLLARLPRHPSALAEAAARLDRAGLALGRPVTRALALLALAPLIGSEPAFDGAESVADSPAEHRFL